LHVEGLVELLKATEKIARAEYNSPHLISAVLVSLKHYHQCMARPERELTSVNGRAEDLTRNLEEGLLGFKIHIAIDLK
jgi:hypothetical protein